MSDAEIGLWLLIGRLRSAGRALGRATLVSYAQIKLPDIAEQYDSLVVGLAASGMLEGDAEMFALTPAGEARLAAVSRENSLTERFYDAYYHAAASSPTHSEFCRRAYGLDLSQHGMADMDQMQMALDELAVTSETSLLDFGCGDGRIAEYVSDVTGAEVYGIDIAGRAIRQARERTSPKAARLHFYAGDLVGGCGELPSGPFQGILAVDSFFFVPDQAALLDAFLRLLAPAGRLAIFYVCQQVVDPAQTPLGLALAGRDIPYRVADLSAENTRHWRLKKQVLLEMEAQFREEEARLPGALFLWRNRMAECDGGMDNLPRYLYLVQKR